MWMNRQQIMSRLGVLHNVVYSEGPWFTWERNAAFKNSSALGKFSKVNNVLLDSPPYLILRNPRLRMYDDFLIKISVSRWDKAFPKSLSKKKKILYVFHPCYMDIIKHIDYDVLVYHCYDNLLKMRGSDDAKLKFQEEELCLIADFVFASSESTKERFETEYKADNIFFLPNGVDFDLFQRNLPENRISLEIKLAAKKTAGYVGSVNDKFDFDLVFELAKRMSHVCFVFVGRVNNLSETNKQKWKSIIDLSNTTHHGLCAKEDVPKILRSLDVNCLFYSSGKNSFAKDCYPLKLHESLASGIPLVSTPIRSVAAFSDHVLLASSVDEWEKKITLAITEPERAPSSKKERVLLAKQNSWDHRAEMISEILHI